MRNFDRDAAAVEGLLPVALLRVSAVIGNSRADHMNAVHAHDVTRRRACHACLVQHSDSAQQSASSHAAAAGGDAAKERLGGAGSSKAFSTCRSTVHPAGAAPLPAAFASAGGRAPVAAGGKALPIFALLLNHHRPPAPPPPRPDPANEQRIKQHICWKPFNTSQTVLQRL